MFKEKISKIWIRILYIIFAVIVSVTLWVFIEITENEIQTENISNIEIDFINMNMLRDRGFFITSYTPETLTVRFEAPRAEIAKLRAPGALTAEVDVASITSTGTQLLVFRLVFPSNVNTNAIVETMPSTSRISLTVDMVQVRQIPVSAEYLGGTASDSLISETTFDPHYITVRGPERVVSRIHEIRVPVLRENLSATIADDFEFVLIDDAENVLDDSLRALLEFSQETVRVTVQITEMKDVPLDVFLSHGLSTSNQNTIVRIFPETIKISGDPIAIGNINSIQLGTIDMTDFSISTTVTFPIIIQDHFANVSGESLAEVFIDIIGLDIDFQVTSNFWPTNVPPGHEVEIITQSLDVRLRGNSEDLAQVTALNLRVVADLADRNPGTQRVPARVFIDGISADIDPVGIYFLTVRIFVEDD